MTRQVNIRLTDADTERLDRLAAGRGLTRTAVVRGLLAQADDAPLPEPPDRDELIRLLGEKAREGSITACQILLNRLDRPGAVPSSTPANDVFREIDELAEKRRREIANRR